MYHQPSKRKEILRRTIVYTLMTITVVTFVTIALLYMLGYRFDSADNTLEQSGLVQFASKPDNAKVLIDGSNTASDTTSKASLLPGVHSFAVSKSGYEKWRKTLTIESGALTWLNYIRLLPHNRSAQTIDSLAQLDGALASPNDKTIALLPDTTKPVITTYDLTRDTPTQTKLTMSPGDYTAPASKSSPQTFKLMEWDKDGKYLIIKHTYDKKTEWLVLNSDSASTATNLTTALDVDVRSIHFAGTSGNELFGLIDGDVRKLNLDQQTISSPLVSDVSEFSLFSDNIISYITTPDTKTNLRSAGIVKAGDRPVVLATSKRPASTFHIAATHYFHKDYVAVSDGNDTIVYGGNFPSQQSNTDQLKKLREFSFIDPVRWLQFSPEGRFVVVQAGDQYRTLDLERNAVSSTSLLAGTSKAKKLRWLDDYLLWSDRSRQLSIREFDGANEFIVQPVASGFDVTLSPNGKYLYSIGLAKNGYQLQRIRMILP